MHMQKHTPAIRKQAGGDAHMNTDMEWEFLPWEFECLDGFEARALVGMDIHLPPSLPPLSSCLHIAFPALYPFLFPIFLFPFFPFLFVHWTLKKKQNGIVA